MKNVYCTLTQDIDASAVLNTEYDFKTLANTIQYKESVFVFFTYDMFKRLYFEEKDFDAYVKTLVDLNEYYDIMFFIVPGGDEKFESFENIYYLEELCTLVLPRLNIPYRFLEQFKLGKTLWFVDVLERYLYHVTQSKK